MNQGLLPCQGNTLPSELSGHSLYVYKYIQFYNFCQYLTKLLLEIFNMKETWEQMQERYQEANTKKGMKEVLDAYIASQNQINKEPELTESQTETVSEK